MYMPKKNLNQNELISLNIENDLEIVKENSVSSQRSETIKSENLLRYISMWDFSKVQKAIKEQITIDKINYNEDVSSVLNKLEKNIEIFTNAQNELLTDLSTISNLLAYTKWKNYFIEWFNNVKFDISSENQKVIDSKTNELNKLLCNEDTSKILWTIWTLSFSWNQIKDINHLNDEWINNDKNYNNNKQDEQELKWKRSKNKKYEDEKNKKKALESQKEIFDIGKNFWTNSSDKKIDVDEFQLKEELEKDELSNNVIIDDNKKKTSCKIKSNNKEEGNNENKKDKDYRKSEIYNIIRNFWESDTNFKTVTENMEDNNEDNDNDELCNIKLDSLEELRDKKYYDEDKREVTENNYINETIKEKEDEKIKDWIDNNKEKFDIKWNNWSYDIDVKPDYINNSKHEYVNVLDIEQSSSKELDNPFSSFESLVDYDFEDEEEFNDGIKVNENELIDNNVQEDDIERVWSFRLIV